MASGPRLPVIATTATCPSRIFSGLILSTTAGCSPASRKSTSQTSPRSGSGSRGIVFRASPRCANPDRERHCRFSIKLGHTLSHTLLGCSPMQELESCLHDVSSARETEDDTVGPQLRRQPAVDPRLPHFACVGRLPCPLDHLYTLCSTGTGGQSPPLRRSAQTSRPCPAASNSSSPSTPLIRNIHVARTGRLADSGDEEGTLPDRCASAPRRTPVTSPRDEFVTT